MPDYSKALIQDVKGLKIGIPKEFFVKGMDEEVAASVLEETAPPSSAGGGGAGIALKNVAERVQRFFGEGSGVDIVSKLGEGTCVTLRLGGAAKLLAERDADAEASETANLLATLE